MVWQGHQKAAGQGVVNELEPFPRTDPKIVVIGGGTGSFTLLGALKDHSKSIVALVNMADDGGSTGVLRDELGVLPPGDVRQCLVALSSTAEMRDLFSYRFDEGTLQGHTLGNLLLTAVEKMTGGDFGKAVEMASDILRINGRVVPVTFDNIRLRMRWSDGTTLRGEHVIDAGNFAQDPRKAELSLSPKARANPMALRAIDQADVVVVAPGDLYTSLGPLLVVPGIGQALQKTSAKKIYVSNLVTKKGQTDMFTVSDHAAEIERFAGGSFLDYVLYNEQAPSRQLASRYKAEDAFVVHVGKADLAKKPYRAIGGDFIGEMARGVKGDKLPVTRSYIRHNAHAVAHAIIDIYETD
jgi:uncharacterized cofD-like protein